MITNETLLYNYYVMYSPWQIGEKDNWDWSFSELEKDLKHCAQNWKAYNGTTRIIEAAELKTEHVEVRSISAREYPPGSTSQFLDYY
jgi:hypothetical protein